MPRILEKISAYRKPLYVIIILAALLNGLVLSTLIHNQSLDMGDDSTFYEFAHDMSHGEVMYKDFIHFRTPGSIALQTGFIKIFGDQPSSVNLAITTETMVFYPLVFLIAGLIIVRKRKNPLYLLAAFLGIAFMPGVAQLRAGFGLLAIACYIASGEIARRRRLLLFLTGVFTGLTFTFGQEIALMVFLVVVAGELLGNYERSELLKRLKPLLGGAILGALPLIFYIVVFSSVPTFLYYVFWYSFVIQPKFMNLPIPGFSYAHLIYYLPFFTYWICFLILYASRKLGRKEGLLLSFGILRLITLLGRSDMGHLLFSVPELFLIAPYFLYSIKDDQFSRKTVRDFLPYGAALIVIFVLAMKVNSIFLIFSPFLILYALRRRQLGTTRSGSVTYNMNAFLALGACLLLFVYLLVPVYKQTLVSARTAWRTRHAAVKEIGGLRADPTTYAEITQVEAAVNQIHPTTIFSFPIIAFFDTLAPHHASRYITFEFETTLSEQNKTISDLKRTRPQVVVMSPMQAQALSHAVWKISDYITANYQIKQEVSQRDIYWVMVPKAHPARDDKLVFQLYRDNPIKTNQTTPPPESGIQNSAQGLNNAVLQSTAAPVHFSVDSPHGSHLSLALLDSSGQTMPQICGQVALHYSNGTSQQTPVCSNQGRLTLALHADSHPVSVDFINPTGQALIWNDPEVTN